MGVVGEKWLQLLGHQGEVFMCVWNPQYRQLASGSADGVCRLWGLQDIEASSIELLEEGAVLSSSTSSSSSGSSSSSISSSSHSSSISSSTSSSSTSSSSNSSSISSISS